MTKGNKAVADVLGGLIDALIDTSRGEHSQDTIRAARRGNVPAINRLLRESKKARRAAVAGLNSKNVSRRARVAK